MADATNQMPAELAEIIALHNEMFAGATMMAEDNAQNQPNEAANAQAPAENTFEPITSQEDLNKILAERLNRQKAQFADYGDLKAKAAKYDEEREAVKTAEERFNERLASLEQELSGSKLEATRARIQARFKLDDEDVELFLTARDEEGMIAQAERLSARLAEAQPKKSNVVPREGRHAGQSSDPLREMARQLFKQS